MIDVVIIDLQTSNIKSVIGACKKVNLKYQLSSNPKDLKKAKSMILPGVGSFRTAMNFLKKKKLIKPIKKFYESGKPIMGICLGMQLFFRESSEYGITKGMNIINSNVEKFTFKNKCRIPNIGWSAISTKKKFNNIILRNINKKKTFYFVHSYYVKVENDINSILKTEHAIKFDSAINNDNIFGVQFHPEKSHKNGMQLLKNFSNI